MVAGGAADSGDQGRHALITTAMMGMIKQLIMKFRFSTHVRAPWVKKTLIVSAIPQVGILAAASGATPSAPQSGTGTGIAVTCATGYSTTGTATCNADDTWDLPTCTGLWSFG